MVVVVYSYVCILCNLVLLSRLCIPGVSTFQALYQYCINYVTIATITNTTATHYTVTEEVGKLTAYLQMSFTREPLIGVSNDEL